MAVRVPQRLAQILGKSVAARRKALGLSQIELANRLNMAPDSLSRIENGFVAPRFPRVEEIARALDCSAADLFRERDDSPEERAVRIVELIHGLPAERQDEIVEIVARVARLAKGTPGKKGAPAGEDL